MDRWDHVLALSLGGMLGVNARHYLDRWITSWAGTAFPWGIFLINVSGCFAIGFLAMTLHRWTRDVRLQAMMVTGFLGGYTTFSTYSLQTLLLWESGARFRSCAYFVGSALAGLIAVVLGVVLGRNV